jgi:hypothetical protein
MIAWAMLESSAPLSTSSLAAMSCWTQGHDAVAGGRGLHDRDELGLGVDDATNSQMSTGQAFGIFFLVPPWVIQKP